MQLAEPHKDFNMELKGLDFFIEKLANSGNPVLAGLAQEMQGQLPKQNSAPTLTPDSAGGTHSDALQESTDQRQEQGSVDNALAVGDQSMDKPKDSVDNMLTSQMPELEGDSLTPSNEQNTKVATYRDLLLARAKK